MAFYTLRLINLLLSMSLLNKLASSQAITVASAPSLTPTDSNVLGFTYVSENGWFSPYHCPTSSIFIHGGKYGRCCTSDTNVDCPIPTTCLSGTVMANSDYQLICTGTGAQTSCVTGTIYHTSGDTSPIYNYQCWPTWSDGNWDATMTVPDLQALMTSPPSTSAAPSSPSATSSSLSPSSSPTSGVSKVVTTTTLVSVTTPSPSPSATTSGSKSGLAGGAIAGIVVGVIAFAMLGLLVWMDQRREWRFFGAIFSCFGATCSCFKSPPRTLPLATVQVQGMPAGGQPQHQCVESLHDPAQPVQPVPGQAPPAQAAPVQASPEQPRPRRRGSL